MPATITWTKDGSSKTATIPDAVLSVLGAFVASQVTITTDPATGQPVSTAKYTDVPDLIFKHCVASLVLPLMQNPAFMPASVAQAVNAAVAAQAGAQAAVGSIIGSIQTT